MSTPGETLETFTPFMSKLVSYFKTGRIPVIREVCDDIETDSVNSLIKIFECLLYEKYIVGAVWCIHVDKGKILSLEVLRSDKEE